MERAFVAGVAVTAIGVAGYALGTTIDYPGRAFSLAAVMVGITLVAVGSANDRRGEGL